MVESISIEVGSDPGATATDSGEQIDVIVSYS